MKTVKNVRELQDMAMRSGAEVEVDGRRLNMERQEKPVGPAAPRQEYQTPPVPPPAPTADVMTREQVDALLAKHSQHMQAQLDKLAAMVTAVLESRPQSAPRQWSHEVVYDSFGRLKSVKSTS